MSTNKTSYRNMTNKQVWDELVVDCLNNRQKTINVGGALRRKAILAMDARIKELEVKKSKLIARSSQRNCQ